MIQDQVDGLDEECVDETEEELNINNMFDEEKQQQETNKVKEV